MPGIFFFLKYIWITFNFLLLLFTFFPSSFFLFPFVVSNIEDCFPRDVDFWLAIHNSELNTVKKSQAGDIAQFIRGLEFRSPEPA